MYLPGRRDALSLFQGGRGKYRIGENPVHAVLLSISLISVDTSTSTVYQH